jgi:hypothetical protein
LYPGYLLDGQIGGDVGDGLIFKGNEGHLMHTKLAKVTFKVLEVLGVHGGIAIHIYVFGLFAENQAKPLGQDGLELVGHPLRLAGVFDGT